MTSFDTEIFFCKHCPFEMEPRPLHSAAHSNRCPDCAKPLHCVQYVAGKEEADVGETIAHLRKNPL